MAKKKGGPNKSLAIRTYLDAHPDAKPKEIVEAMKKKGIAVNAQFVSTVKTNSKKKPGKIGTKRRGRPVGSGSKNTKRKVASSAGGQTVTVESLLKLQKVIEEIGSIEDTKSALSALEKLAR